jgi:hypothetical protein
MCLSTYGANPATDSRFGFPKVRAALVFKKLKAAEIFRADMKTHCAVQQVRVLPLPFSWIHSVPEDTKGVREVKL